MAHSLYDLTPRFYLEGCRRTRVQSIPQCSFNSSVLRAWSECPIPASACSNPSIDFVISIGVIFLLLSSSLPLFPSSRRLPLRGAIRTFLDIYFAYFSIFLVHISDYYRVPRARISGAHQHRSLIGSDQTVRSGQPDTHGLHSCALSSSSLCRHGQFGGCSPRALAKPAGSLLPGLEAAPAGLPNRVRSTRRSYSVVQQSHCRREGC